MDNTPGSGGGAKGTIALIIVLVFFVVVGMSSCSGGGSSSSYQLRNKDGSLNQEYVNDMQDYFRKHPEKLP